MSNPNLAKDLKNVSAKDRKQIEQAQEMLGPDPLSMGVIKNTFGATSARISCSLIR